MHSERLHTCVKALQQVRMHLPSPDWTWDLAHIHCWSTDLGSQLGNGWTPRLPARSAAQHKDWAKEVQNRWQPADMGCLLCDSRTSAEAVPWRVLLVRMILLIHTMWGNEVVIAKTECTPHHCQCQPGRTEKHIVGRWPCSYDAQQKNTAQQAYVSGVQRYKYGVASFWAAIELEG